MIQTGITIKSIGDFLKEYLSIIIIFPAFIGGLWQAFELVNISYSYIRFFSISQIVPDGILILLFIIYAVSANIIGFFIQRLFDTIKIKKTSTQELTALEKEKIRKSEVKNGFITFIIFYLIGIIYFMFVIWSRSKFFDLIHSVMFAVIIIQGCIKFLNISFYASDFVGRKLLLFCNLLLFLFYIMIGIYFCREIHNNFLFTDNLDNMENIDCTLQEKNPTSQREILYFNDKYIFIKILDKNIIDVESKKPKEKIHIIELEKLFKD